MKKCLLLLLFYCQLTTAQKLKKADKFIIENLKSEIEFLASDRLEGRRTGTEGEKIAYEYLAEQFKSLGLLPKGDNNTYLQTFEINEGKEVLLSTYLTINEKKLSYEDEYFPFIFSALGTIQTNASPVFQEKDRPWFWDIKELMKKNENNPHFHIEDAIKNKAIEFAKKGATALIVYNTDEKDEGLKFEGKEKDESISIPVLFIKKAAAQKYLEDGTEALDISLKVDIGNKIKEGHNVMGYIDNGVANTIIIGAHYDHLGYGEDHNSLWTGALSIHNGADDNASGTASVIELARMLKKSTLKNNNYLFICFSGEELGLFGSKYFTAHPTINLEAVNYMVNSDMIGRLNDTTHSLTIGGYGTSPSWGKIFNRKNKFFNAKFDSSGIGPSDHTSFYLKNIPVLFFFTGTHKDYHKPTDDAEKINFTGELQIIKYIYGVIEETNKLEKVAFSKTKDPAMGSARFTVSLGIMPDYAFSGFGVRADGIIEGKIAQKAGIHSGDIIIKLGDFTFSDLNSYMNVLSKFKKGDATIVTVLRDNDQLTFDIVF
ncbi:MAG: M28 family peptidase [Ginsengibacter sp.]